MPQMKKLLLALTVGIFCHVDVNAGFAGNDTNITASQRANNRDEIAKLEKSYTIWTSAKRQKGASYRYSSVFASWTGYREQTTVGISNDRVSMREFHSWDRDGKTISSWAETKPLELGTHDEGAEVKTTDDLYDDCKTILMTKSKKTNHLLIEYDEYGLVSSCFFIPHNCADDCAQGFEIYDLIFREDELKFE